MSDILTQHNEIIVATRRRADAMEDRFAELVRRILVRVGLDAANLFEEYVHDHLVASGRRRRDLETISALPVLERRELRTLALTAAAPDLTSTATMIALYPRPEEAAILAHEGGEPAELLHVTLAFLGDTEGPLLELRDALTRVAANHAPLEGAVGGVGSFGSEAGQVGVYRGEGKRPLLALPNVPGLVEARTAVCAAVRGIEGVEVSHNHGFTAHVTLEYAEDDPEKMPPLSLIGRELHFDAIHLVRGDEQLAVLPLCGPQTLLAAGDQPAWTPPAANEVIDIDSVIAQLRTKTDPVRQALIANVMGEALRGSGIDWDAANPFAARVLEQSGSQIVSIAETTQLNVMRIIRAAWDEGLTIPDTAKAIRKGMREASSGRALLIARTELVGAANGGSLAAAQITESATGDSYLKQWNTAEGASFPRHEEYDGLDGQTVELDAGFDVGGYELEYPGDPGGPPEEICNCRCALSYK